MAQHKKVLIIDDQFTINQIVLVSNPIKNNNMDNLRITLILAFIIPTNHQLEINILNFNF